MACGKINRGYLGGDPLPLPAQRGWLLSLENNSNKPFLVEDE